MRRKRNTKDVSDELDLFITYPLQNILWLQMISISGSSEKCNET